MKLLHLEDNDSDAELVAAVLAREWPDCHITRLASESELRASLEGGSFDLILSDYSMPGFDGVSALDIVRESCPDTPFVFLSGTIGEERAIEALKHGAVDYVLKDSPGRLLSAVRQALKHAQRDAAKRQAEEGLRKSREQFQQIAEAIEDFIVLLDGEGQCLYANPAFQKLLGTARGCIGSNLYQHVHRDDVKALRAFILRAGTGHPRGEIEFRIVTPSGGVRHLEAGLSVPRGSDHALPTLLLAGRDVTQRKAAEEKLQEQASLLGKARDAICLINLEFRITYWNASAERIYGRLASDAVGQDLRQMLFASQLPRFDTAFALTLAHGEWQGEFRLSDHTGRDLVVDSSWSLVNDASGRPKSILCIDTDVTSRKQLELELQRAQRIEGLGMLAGGIAHDLNNILSPVLMSVGLLRSTRGSAEDTMILDTLEASATHGTDLVKQILLFARGGEGERAELQLGTMLEEYEGFLKTSLRRSQLTLDHDSDLWPVLADATQLKQVLMNLCVNARDAMPGGGRVQISATNVSVMPGSQRGFHGEIPAGRHVRLSVADSGSGIPREVLEKIFDPFFTTKELGKGTGLGLSTIAGIVQKHDGAIQVESTVGRGTTFHIYLPAMPAVPSTEAPEPPPAARQLPQGRGECILVIDDDEGIRLVAEKILQAQGFQVFIAGDGATGIEEFRRHRNDIRVVICDQIMPGLRGAEVLARIKAEAPETKLIAMSGLMEKGASDLDGESVRCLPKPLKAETLLRAVREALDEVTPG